MEEIKIEENETKDENVASDYMDDSVQEVKENDHENFVGKLGM